MRGTVPQSSTSAALCVVAFVCWLFPGSGAQLCAQAAGNKHAGLAPKGVPYGNNRSREACQLKAIGPNLLDNGSFEKGRHWPYNWDPVDGLGSFWVKEGTHGKRCIRLYTDVLDTQWIEWNEKVMGKYDRLKEQAKKKGKAFSQYPLPEAPAKIPTHPPYYDTVGGIHGIHYRSRMVKVRPGAIYRVSLDARVSPCGTPKVFTKGFRPERQRIIATDGDKTFYLDSVKETDAAPAPRRRRGKKSEVRYIELMRNTGRAPMSLHGCGKEWKRFARTFHPAKWTTTRDDKPIFTEYLQVQIYAYWPVGNYFFDNVKLEIVGYDEPPETKKETADSAKDRDKKKPPPKLAEDEFPVFAP